MSIQLFPFRPLRVLTQINLRHDITWESLRVVNGCSDGKLAGLSGKKLNLAQVLLVNAMFFSLKPYVLAPPLRGLDWTGTSGLVFSSCDFCSIVQLRLLSKVVNNILLKADEGECSVLMLLYFSATFDTVQRSIHTHRLKQWVTDQFFSCFTERRFCSWVFWILFYWEVHFYKRA